MGRTTGTAIIVLSFLTGCGSVFSTQHAGDQCRKENLDHWVTQALQIETSVSYSTRETEQHLEEALIACGRRNAGTVSVANAVNTPPKTRPMPAPPPRRSLTPPRRSTAYPVDNTLNQMLYK